MSGWGIIASGLAGGANAVGDITKGYIDQDRRLESAKVLSDVDEQKAQRLAEYAQRMGRENQTYNTTGPGSVELDAAAQRRALAAGDSARAVKKADLADTGLIQAERAKADADAIAVTGREVAATKAKAGDKEYLAGQSAIALADPRVAAQIAASRAATAAAYANAAESGARTEGYKQSNDDKKKLNTLYDKAGELLSDAKMGDAQRASELAKVERQIVLMKSKTGQAGGKAPDPGSVTEETEYDADGKPFSKKVTTKRPMGAEGPKGGETDPIKAAMDANRAANPAAKSGAPAKPVAAAEQRAAIPQDANPLAAYNDATLRRIEAIRGHSEQSAAINELRRREQAKPEIDTNGIGFGG